MKMTRERILKTIQDCKQGLTFQEIVKQLKAFSARRRATLSRLLKLLEQDGEIMKQKQRYKSATPRGKHGRNAPAPASPRQDLRRIAHKYELPLAFPPTVLQEAEGCRRDWEKELARRELIEEWTITIDSETAKDLDDAISLTRIGRGWRLGVHIADVSWFVHKGALLDQEAFRRGTSVYLIDQVLPMFPPRLSNQLCSLNADEPKLCFSAFITFDGRGRVTDTHFTRTAIQVARRFSYKEVEAILKGRRDPDRKRLQEMARLAEVLRKKRSKQGSLMFEIPEIKIELDKDGNPTGVIVPARLQSEALIEEFMLAANQAVSAFLEEKGHSLFRIHEYPNEEKLGEFYDFAGRIGLSLKQPAHITPMSMQRTLDVIRSQPSAAILNSLLLRSMQKAVYSADNPGHFGLAFTTYTHFTSPIRRYPDLIVHRQLAAALGGKRGYGRKALEKIALQSTEREQRAMDAEREFIRIKGARYLEQFKGKPLKGRITGLMPWGMFLTLLPFGLDGLLPVNALKDDHYTLDSYGHSLIGARRGRRFTIGDVVDVTVARVNLEKGLVDLGLV